VASSIKALAGRPSPYQRSHIPAVKGKFKKSLEIKFWGNKSPVGVAAYFHRSSHSLRNTMTL
jgi:hypothetical protein